MELDHPIHIESENWDELALVELITPTDMFNVTGVNNIFFVRVQDAKKDGLHDGQVCAEDLRRSSHRATKPLLNI